ncbi:oxidoreductase mmfh [Streptomyces longisporoflavus]|uniref:acyl-CoA dehydrogenase family protein n=1 Tax=Streptomyces longisporoflavus TaxID=28044 RepID=UPI00167D354B|nr:acyl-CoA dehydrogenase family protein [Streptomyces longisporoflavus]GGV68609.1 oxidoreductase mmfh [Streptomyces longisporoflavus]
MPADTQTTTPGADWARDAAVQAALHATESEHGRTLHPPVAQALTDAGFARYFVPARFGGTSGTFGELIDAIALVGEGCTSSAWCAALQAAHGRLAAHLPPRGQADLWQDGPDTPIAAALVPPAGTLTPAGGGYRLSGRWNLASGVMSAHWILLATADPAAPRVRQLILAIPRGDITVHDTWHNSGLRGTGSHSLSVDDAFVPAHRTMPRDALAAGRQDDGAARCHRIPYTLVASLMFAAPALGAARGALRAWTRLTATRPAGLSDPTAQQVLARSSAETDAAHLLLVRAARRADHAPPDELPTALNQRDAAVAVEMLVAAVERLFRHGGARAQSEAEPLQRLWRDIHALAGHGALQLPAAAAVYSQWVDSEQAHTP